MRQDRRSHLEEKIRQHQCDLDFTTERNRSPHTLVCTKNKASYQAELKTYRQDQQSSRGGDIDPGEPAPINDLKNPAAREIQAPAIPS